VARAEKIPAAPWTVDAARIARFRKLLLGWFGGNKRNLPWRVSRDPYRIWISEIMLQQTRVAAVIPYYEKFLTQYPNVKALAEARIENVLRYWAGLGYYSRARNLHVAARQISSEHAGEFPREHSQAVALAGIGNYTAAAVLSIAYGAPHAVLDGNVARVLARLGAIRGDLREPKRWTKLGDAAQTLLARRVAGDWNQAMMELGATVCTPQTPDCGACPVKTFCRARAMGIQNSLPAKRIKRATENVFLAAAVFLDARGRTLLVHPKHPPENEIASGAGANDSEGAALNSAHALFSNLWQFPAIEIANGAISMATAGLATHIAKLGAKLAAKRLSPLSAARHTVTFRRITLAPYLIRVKTLPKINGAQAIALDSVDRVAVSSATRKVAAAALRSLDRPAPTNTG
jgi:A/G-specific adenine glycosylase